MKLINIQYCTTIHYYFIFISIFIFIFARDSHGAPVMDFVDKGAPNQMIL